VKWHHHAFPIFAISGGRFCHINVQIYVRVGVLGVGGFDVWLRKMHVEGKRWKGAVNKMKKELISRKRYIYPLQIPQLYKSDVPDSTTV
jgi:hypothetical protein